MESPLSVNFKSKHVLDTWDWVIDSFTHQVSWWRGTLPVLQGFFLFVLQTGRTGYLKLSCFVVLWSLFLYKKVSGTPFHQCGFTGQDVLLPGAWDFHQDLWQGPLCRVTCVSDRALTVLAAVTAVSRSIQLCHGLETSLSIAWGFCLVSVSARGVHALAGRLRGLLWPKQIRGAVASQAWPEGSSRCPLPSWKWCVLTAAVPAFSTQGQIRSHSDVI